MRDAPYGYRFVIRYNCRDGKPGWGIANHYWHITDVVRVLLEDNARDIVITDETVYIDRKRKEQVDD